MSQQLRCRAWHGCEDHGSSLTGQHGACRQVHAAAYFSVAPYALACLPNNSSACPAGTTSGMQDARSISRSDPAANWAVSLLQMSLQYLQVRML